MTTLTESLEARIAEDEAAARATLIDVDGSGDWRADEYPVALTVDLYRVRDVNARPVVEEIRSLDDDDDPDNITQYVNGAAVSQHVARHDPARVLREVEAKRAILDTYKHAEATWDIVGEGFVAVERAAHALAAVYSDHPDYRKEWAA